MKEIGNKIRYCGDKCRQTDIVKIIDTLLDGNYATLLVIIYTKYRNISKRDKTREYAPLYISSNLYSCCRLFFIISQINLNVILQPTINCEAAIKRTMNKTQCRLTMAPEATSFQHMFMGVPKASPYAKELNQA